MLKSTEQILIKRCKVGDSSAYGPLIKMYRKQLYSYLLRLLGEKTIAEDVFQEVLIRAWKGIDKYSEKQKFSSWLFAIAHNCSMDELRKRKSGNLFVNNDDDEIGHDNTPIEILEKEELINKIFYAVDMLSTKQKNVFLLRVEGGLSYKEISDITNEPLNTVLSHMNYSVKKIRKSLAKNYE